MRTHYENILHDLPQRFSNDAIFRPPFDITTFGVRLSHFDMAHSYLQAAPTHFHCSKFTGATVKLDATARMSDARRVRGRALHPANLAISSHSWDRDAILLRHSDDASGHFSRVSLAEADG